VSRSGRKHKIGNAHILAAMRNAGVPVLVPGTDQLLYIGKDDRASNWRWCRMTEVPAA
jgi:hypothetical protein